MDSLFYLPINTEEERQFAKDLAEKYESKGRKANWNTATNLIITNCKFKYLASLPGSFEDVSRCNNRYQSKLCDLETIKVEALKIFILGE